MSGPKTITLLSKCPVGDVPKLLQSVVEGLCGRKPTNYHDYQGVYSTEEFWPLIDAIKSIIKEAVKNGSSRDEVSKEISSLPVELQNCFHECLANCREEIRTKLVTDSCFVGRAHLTDFDWQLKLIMGSDKIAHAREPIASVSFNILDDNKEKQLLLEMTKEELSNFIASLESANKAISHLQA